MYCVLAMLNANKGRYTEKIIHLLQGRYDEEKKAAEPWIDRDLFPLPDSVEPP